MSKVEQKPQAGPVRARSRFSWQKTRSPSSTPSSRARREGFEVTIARDGPEALAQFEAIQPDLVLLDIMLPKLSGIDVCRAIRARSAVPIIMVTAKGTEIDTVVGLEVGADDYVSKPYRLRELVARMRAVLRRSPTRPDGLEQASGGEVREAIDVGDITVDIDRQHGDRPRYRRAAAAQGIRPTRAPRRERRAGPHPRHPHRPCLGNRLRRGYEDPRRAHQAAPRPRGADRKSPTHHHDRAEGWATASSSRALAW